MQVGLGTVLDGDPAPLPKGAQPPNFRSISVAAKWLHDQDVTLIGMEPGLGPGDCVRWGPRSPPQKGGGTSRPNFQFSAHVYCGHQTAGWIKMVYLAWRYRTQPRRLCVRWGPSPPLPKGGAPSPIFGPFLLWSNGWMHQNAAWYGCKPQPRGFCVR